MDNSEGKNLIFLISQPRSGSTLFQLMLAKHQDIATTTEPWIALHPIFALHGFGVSSIYDSALARKAVLEFLKESGIKKEFYINQVGKFLNTIYNKAIEKQNKKYFLDKTPRYYYIIDELVEIFPEAKFVVLLRNPLAVLNSILTNWVKEDLSVLCWCIDDLISAPNKIVNTIEKNPDRCFVIKYENLVQQPDVILKQVSEYLGIEFYKDMMNYENTLNLNWTFGDKTGIQNANGPTTNSIDKWKSGFRSSQNKIIAGSYLNELGQNLIEKMGYEYEELKSFIEKPKNSKNYISLSTILNFMHGISDDWNMKRAFFNYIIEEEMVVDDKIIIYISFYKHFDRSTSCAINIRIMSLLYTDS